MVHMVDNYPQDAKKDKQENQVLHHVQDQGQGHQDRGGLAESALERRPQV